MKNIFRYLFLLFLLLSTDQFLKYTFLKNSVCNKNIAWSIPIAPGVFYFISTLIIFFLIYYFLKSERNSEKIALIFVFSGAISNLTDRVARGCVVDFIDLKFWPVFNLADVYITMGVVLLIATGIKKYQIPDTKY